jgi:ATP-dependent DNA ligase
MAVDRLDIRMMHWTVGRKRLEALAEGWRPPSQLSPVMVEVGEAQEWMEAFGPAGVEGLVVKGAASRYAVGVGSSASRERPLK